MMGKYQIRLSEALVVHRSTNLRLINILEDDIPHIVETIVVITEIADQAW